ncbi:hypothetical protein DOY81_004831 [Sarcophaga bullata]|nr:hypothetical protein DOY81_004831 [Sarcophaga bullata]
MVTLDFYQLPPRLLILLHYHHFRSPPERSPLMPLFLPGSAFLLSLFFAKRSAISRSLLGIS